MEPYRFAIDCVIEGRIAALSTATDIDLCTVCQALNYGLRYSHHEDRRAAGYIGRADARAVLKAHACGEPAETQLRDTFMKPLPVKPEGSRTHWPINAVYRVPADTVLWGLIHGIERGWFAYDRTGFLQWCQNGRDRYAAGDSLTVVDSVTGQSGFAF